MPQLAFPCALVAAFFMEKKSIRPLSGKVPTVISFALFLFYAVRISRENILDPAINILVILLVVRLLSERIPRNYLQIFALSLFALSASSLYNLSPVFLGYLLILLLCIAASLVLLTFFTVDSRLALSRNGMKRLITVAVAMPAAAMPLILLFFVIMPRPQFPLWDFLAPSEEKVTGLSEQIVPGSSSKVWALKSPVLRAQSPKLAKEDLYWRGIVLNTPRNNAWVRTAVKEGDYVKTKGGEVVLQTIFPEPNSGPFLITLDAPLKVNGIRVEQAPDLVFTRKRNTGRIRYDTVSSLNHTITVRGEIDRNFYLKLPDRVSSRVKALGKRIFSQGRTDRERLVALEEYFSSARLRYTTSGLPRSDDPIGEFLFQSMAGHCELFASSFMILLREAGIPARLVGGYYGGDYNEIGGYYLVTEDMAHVWVEVFLQGTGWVRKDPSVFAVNFTAGGDDARNSIVARARKFSDSLNYYWNLAVISYDLEKQIHIFQSASSTVRNISFPVSTRWLLLIMVGIGGLAAGYRFFVRKLASSPEKRLLRTFYALFAKKYPGVTACSSTGLMELAESTADPCVRDFAEIFYGSVYRDRRLSASQIVRLQELINAMKIPAGKEAGADVTRHNSLT